MNPRPNPTVRGPLVAQWTLALVCLALAGVSVAMFLGEQRQRRELAQLLTEAGLNDTLERVGYERTLHHAQILTARSLLYAVLDARNQSMEPIAVGSHVEESVSVEIGSAKWDEAVDRLPKVIDLARRVLEAQPNSWQGAMLLGAAIYLERSIRRDRRLYTEFRDWEQPLEQALERAPGREEPRRFLAAAYLEVWPALSPEKKALARALLEKSFASDPKAFNTLLSTWLDLAEDWRDAFSVIPNTSLAWRQLEQRLAEQREWTIFCQARIRFLEALLEENERGLAEAEERLALGEFFHSRSLLLQVVARSPLDRRFATAVGRALERYPPGLHGLSSTESLRAWLRWSLNLHPLGLNPLPDRVTGRLAGAAGQLEAYEKAHAALIGGEANHAFQLEQLAETLSSEAWGPYMLAKSRWYLARDQPGEAGAVLDLVDPATRRGPVYMLVRQEVARARGDLVELAIAERELEALRREEWSAGQWSWRGYRASLILLPMTTAVGIRMNLNRVPKDGAVIEIHWDGRAVAFQPALADGEIELRFPVSQGPHLLEMRMVAGAQLFPGRVSLLEPTL